ncbi:hypothetical protein ACJJTC_016666 [Scirpophaga incertulas]
MRVPLAAPRALGGGPPGGEPWGPSPTSPNSAHLAPVVPEITRPQIRNQFGLNPDISGSIGPRLPVFGFPVEGAPSSIRQAGFLGVVFGNFETVRNQLNPVQETRGRLPVETPALYDALVRSYECLKIGQYGRQLSKPIFGAGFLRNQGSQDYRVWVPLGRFELLYRMALCLAL